MMNTGNMIQPLRNVGAFAALVKRVENRAMGLPGMATFSGPSGYGKSYACAYAAASLDCIHVSIQPLWTVKTLLKAILRELSILPHKTNADMGMQINEGLVISNRTLIIDEADYAIDKKWIEILRGMFDGSDTPIILVGEEDLPQKLTQWKRVHGRMIDFLQAEPANLSDARLLRRLYAKDIEIDEALMSRIVQVSDGSARYISNNLAHVQEQAKLQGIEKMTLADWGNQKLREHKAPVPREGLL
ncbi:MAG: ATP-binding protein [Pseudomonadota bacterium]